VNKYRKGSTGVVPKMMLLNTFHEMHAPYTQVLFALFFIFNIVIHMHPLMFPSVP
jgi:hypothetical protein